MVFYCFLIKSSMVIFYFDIFVKKNIFLKQKKRSENSSFFFKQNKNKKYSKQKTTKIKIQKRKKDGER